MRTFYNIGDGSLKVAKFETKETSDKMVANLRDENHDDYFLSDKDLGVKYNLKTAMVKKIREASSVPIKEDRILRVLRTIPTNTMFVDRIALLLKDRITYNSLYVLMRNNKIPFMRKNKINPATEPEDNQQAPA
jgi:hypothetical protein